MMTLNEIHYNFAILAPLLYPIHLTENQKVDQIIFLITPNIASYV
jgi:hypothetical protein